MTSHEDLSRQHLVRGPSNRGFGLVFFAFFLLVSLAPLRRHQPFRLWAAGLSAIFLAATLFAPSLLKPLNRGWTALGHLLGRVTTPIVTAGLFFLVFTPAGFLARLLRRNPLRLGFDPTADSYWIERRPPGPRPEDMANQF